MSNVYRTIDCVVASPSLLRNRRPLAVKPSKKVFLLIVSISVGLYPTAASPIQQNSETHGLYKYKLLQTSTCNYGDLFRFETCEKNEQLWDIYIDYCGFADLCDPGFKPVCVKGDDGEILHICSPKGLTCHKGYRRKVWRIDSNVVVVKEEICPHGRYQPYESNCYDACANTYEDIKDLPEQYAVYSKGDNVSPPLIYCNFEIGLYKLGGKFLYKYDEEIRYQHFHCTSVSDYNPCSGEQFPIPNGTCVFPCEGDLKRDIHDDFRCKVLSRAEADSNTERTKMEDNDFNQTTEKAANTQKQREINIINLTTQNARYNTKTSGSHVPEHWHVTIVIGSCVQIGEDYVALSDLVGFSNFVLVCASLLLAVAEIGILLLEH